MRDLTKSMVRFSWAMTMLGVRQATMLVRDRRDNTLLDAVSHAAETQMSGVVRTLYRTGDHLQSAAVDTAAEIASGSWTNPASALSKGLRGTWEALDHSRTATRDGGQ